MRERLAKLMAGSLYSFLILLILFGASCQKVDKSTARPPTVIKTKEGVEMVLIPAGWFEMGSRQGKTNESPVHKVWVNAFLMDRYEVTQEQYGKLVPGNPSHFKGPQNPMEQMSWANAALYCNARSRAEGFELCYDEESGKCNFEANGYRLPTEAEWEYACRAGTKTDYFFGRDARKLKDYAWYAENSFERTFPWGKKKPNPWGLYDMYGNVAEWCNDIYDQDYYKHSPEKNPRGPTRGKKYVLRGGAWSSSADVCRSSYRVGEEPGFQDACFARDTIGFRCVRNAPTDFGIQTFRKSLIKKRMISDFGIEEEFNSEFRTRGTERGQRRASEFQIIGSSTNENQYSPLIPLTTPLPPFIKGDNPLAPFVKGDKGGRGLWGARELSSKTGFIYHDIYLQHKTGANHPEAPQRLTAIIKKLKEKGLGEHEGSPIQFVTPTSLLASPEWLTTIHTPQYVERVKKSCQESAQTPSLSAVLDSVDTPISPESYEVAVAAVGGVLSAIDGVMAGKFRNAFCAIRPPGHHALKDRAMGFCIFNNVAIGARYIQKKYGLSKVLIVDWDVHHGNGTQAAFYDDPTVLYFSTHQYPFYPGSGSEGEKGTGKGLGYTINVPLPAGSGDKEYKKAFEEKLRLKAVEFNPDFVLISAGFDAHKDDPLGGMNVTANGFAEMTSIVKGIAERCCEGRLVSVLEGGYSLDGLAESVEAHISVLLDN
jgi:acetoin utilization deacetylase AcuC-like enzyme/formylglycine-generating enzyme required for sulfatase activity